MGWAATLLVNQQYCLPIYLFVQRWIVLVSSQVIVTSSATTRLCMYCIHK